MSIYSVNILSVCLSVMLQKALLLMDVFILVIFISGLVHLCMEDVSRYGRRNFLFISNQVEKSGMNQNNLKSCLYVFVFLRWILKKLFCLTASPKSVMVATNSASKFCKSTYIYEMSKPVTETT